MDGPREMMSQRWALLRGACLEGGCEAAQVFGQAAGVIGCGAADALDHVDAVAALGADAAVVLRAPEVRAPLRHLRVYQLVHASAPQVEFNQAGFGFDFKNTARLFQARHPADCRTLGGSPTWPKSGL